LTLKSQLVITYLLIFFFTLVLGCRKGPGEGGKASVTGKIKVEYYNWDWSNLIVEYPAKAEDVYIVFGNSTTYNDKTETHYDGTYSFNYLLPGRYELYVYSKDSTGSADNKVAVIKEFIILEEDNEIILDDITIVDN